jgi:hypothetical protein
LDSQGEVSYTSIKKDKTDSRREVVPKIDLQHLVTKAARLPIVKGEGQGGVTLWLLL